MSDSSARATSATVQSAASDAPAGSDSAPGLAIPAELEEWFLPEPKVNELPPGIRIEGLEPRHSERVNALFNEVFRAQRPLAHVHWKYWENPAGPAQGGIAVEEESGRALAAYVVLPHVFWVGGQELRFLYQVAETAVHPAARAGGRLLRAVFRRAQERGLAHGGVGGYGGQSNEEAVKVGTRWLGYRILFSLQSWERRLSLAPLGRARAAGAGHLLGRAADAALRPFAHRLVNGFGGELEPCDGFGPLFDEIWERLRGRYQVCVARSAAHLEWRFGRCPVERHRCLVARTGSGPAGYVVWREWTDAGVRRATVLDLLDGQDPRVAAALLSGAARQAARDGCEFMFFSAMPGSAAEEALRGLRGFRPSRREPPDRLLAAPARGGVTTPELGARLLLLLDPRNWHYTQGDSDYRD